MAATPFSIVGAVRRRWLPFVLGLITLPLAAYVVNHTAFPDSIIRPLLRPDTRGPGDVIVVPAAGVTAACTANLNSVRRVLLAAKLYHEGRAPLVMFTGGRPNDGPSCAVATVMATLAESLGVPAARMRTETLSTNTWENALRSAPMLRAEGAQRLVLVTDTLHMARVEASFARFGFTVERASVPVFEGHRDNVDMLRQGFREFAALQYYEWSGRIRDPWSTPVAGHGLAHSGAHITTPPSNTSMQDNLAYPQGPLVVLGASYAGGWTVKTLAGRPVVNKGVHGQQSFELLARFDTDVVGNRPRAVLLWGFINDVFRSPRERADQAVERVKQSYREMLSRARAARIEPVLLTEVTMRQRNTLKDNVMTTVGRWLGRSGYVDYVNGHVLAINAWLRELAGQEGVLLLDIQPVLSTADNRRQRAYAVDDGSHISEAGYQALTQYVTPIVEARFSR